MYFFFFLSFGAGWGSGVVYSKRKTKKCHLQRIGIGAFGANIASDSIGFYVMSFLLSLFLSLSLLFLSLSIFSFLSLIPLIFGR